MSETITTLTLEKLLRHLMAVWGETRPDRLLARYPTVEGERIVNALLPLSALDIAGEQSEAVLEALCQDGLATHFQVNDAVLYVLTPLGIIVASGSNDARELQSERALQAVTDAIQAKWRGSLGSPTSKRGGRLSPQYASFLLFLLIGGAVGNRRPLCWDQKDVQQAATARELLITLAVSLGSETAERRWKGREELINFMRRPVTQHNQRLGKPLLRKEQGATDSERLLFLDVQPTAEGLRPLLDEAGAVFGFEALNQTLHELERIPWGRDPKHQQSIAQIRRLFGGQHPPPLSHRQLLTRVGTEAAAGQRGQTRS